MEKVIIILLSVLALTNAISTGGEDIWLGEDQSHGFISLGEEEDLFFWLFRSRTNKEMAPLTIWLTGGPGCSSEIALFVENGPYTINPDLTLKSNPYSWNNNSHLLYVDQPVGTGYSKGSSDVFARNEEKVSSDFYSFLVKFMDRFPEYNGRPLFITGESYAGHFIPAIASYVYSQRNSNINLIGVAVGNGWVDPFIQYPQYAEFARENKLVDEQTYESLKVTFEKCQKIISEGDYNQALAVCQEGTETIIGYPERFNVYDIRKSCDFPPLCYDLSPIQKFLSKDEVVSFLGVQGRDWEMCNSAVHSALMGDWINDLSAKVEYLLRNGIHVLVYSGDKDFVCNWRGGEAWSNALEWDFKAQFINHAYEQWEIEGTSYGEIREVNNLAFLRVFDAGHQVPMDQPLASLHILNHVLIRWSNAKSPKFLASI